MQMTHTYLTITAPSEGLFKEKGSKFIGLAFPVETEEQVREILQRIKQQYYDARHHCYAFMLGARHDRFRSSDAGEPAHTAGTPILGQIRSRNLTNILVMVIRYFGGTKLGVPGLIAAYKAAAADALDNAQVIEQEEKLQLEIRFPYEAMSQVMRLQKDNPNQIETAQYDAQCYLLLSVPVAAAEKLIAGFEKLAPAGVTLNQV